jgi:hypothetical protein
MTFGRSTASRSIEVLAIVDFLGKASGEKLHQLRLACFKEKRKIIKKIL